METPRHKKKRPCKKIIIKNFLKFNFTNNPVFSYIGGRDGGRLSHAGIGFAGFFKKQLTD